MLFDVIELVNVGYGRGEASALYIMEANVAYNMTHLKLYIQLYAPNIPQYHTVLTNDRG